MRNISDKFVNKITTHNLRCVNSFRKSWHLWNNVKNMEQTDRTQITTQ